MKKTGFYFMCLLIFLLSNGCATTKGDALLSNPMKALSELNTKSIVLMNIGLKNTINTSHQPNIQSIIVSKNGEKDEFLIPGGLNIDDQYSYRLASINLEPGSYKLISINGDSGAKSFLLPPAHFKMPVCEEFEVKSGSITYIGIIKGVLRKKKSDDELSGGSVVADIPILGSTIVQALAGYSTGTFEIEIRDEYERDTGHFKKNYPILESYNIEKAVMAYNATPPKADCR